VGWEARTDGVDWAKVPLDAKGERFHEAPSGYEFDRALGLGKGLGVVPGKYGEHHLCVVDADDCVTDGIVEPWVQERFAEFGSYCEKSPSDQGLRLLFLSKSPFWTLKGTRNGNDLAASCVEWHTVTGKHLGWSPKEVADLTDQHPTLLSELFGTSDTDRLTRQLLEWIEPVTLAEPDGKVEVWDALTHLKRWRVVEWRGWIRVMWCLASGGLQYLEMAKEWSRLCPEKYREENAYRIFEKGPPPGYDLRRLRQYAREDDPIGYKPADMHERLTDTGNGRIVARLGAGRVAYAEEWECWAKWDGTRWNINGSAGRLEVERITKEATQQRLDQLQRSYAKLDEAEAAAAQLPEDVGAAVLAEIVERRKGLGKVYAWAMTSENGNHFDEAVKRARSEKLVGMKKDQFDQHPMLFNCVNCTVDLTTGETRKHDPKDYLTQVSPTEWVPGAPCPRWIQFLGEVFRGDEKTISYVQKLSGYFLTGDVREQILPICWGEGSNGKSLLLNLLKHVMGTDYAATTPRKFLALTQFDAHPTSMATLYRRRLMVDMEMGDQIKLDEELVKRLTGGDRISCRRMRENFWEFDPTHKLVLGTNHMPRVEGTDHAIWRRLKKLPFLQRFRKPDDEPKEGDIEADLGLEKKLEAEAPGILQWMFEGCRRWLDEGLGDPPAGREATREFREEESGVKRFLAEMFVREEGAKLKKAYVWQLWGSWRIGESANEMTPNAFGREMTACGIRKDTNSNYLGLRERREVDKGTDGQPINPI
jgi:putative DNA primase/helicase